MPLKKYQASNRSQLPAQEDVTKIKAHKLLIIRALQRQRSQLSISLAGSSDVSASIILEVDTAGDWFELDELPDEIAHATLLETKRYDASGRLNGVNIRFTTEITAHRKEAGLIRYRSRLPETLYQSQKRADHRTHVSIMSAPKAHLILSNNQLIEGEISNISINGALISVPTDSHIASGDNIAQCMFKTLDKKMIIVEAKVRRVVNPDNSSRSKLGCEFINLDLMTTQEIQRYAASIERLNARRR